MMTRRMSRVSRLALPTVAISAWLLWGCSAILGVTDVPEPESTMADGGSGGGGDGSLQPNDEDAFVSKDGSVPSNDAAPACQAAGKGCVASGAPLDNAHPGGDCCSHICLLSPPTYNSGLCGTPGTYSIEVDSQQGALVGATYQPFQTKLEEATLDVEFVRAGDSISATPGLFLEIKGAGVGCVDNALSFFGPDQSGQYFDDGGTSCGLNISSAEGRLTGTFMGALTDDNNAILPVTFSFDQEVP